MAYAAGNVAVDPGLFPQQIRSLIETQMTAAGWEFVEDYNNWRVWRCPVAVNGVQDFYVMLFATTMAAIGVAEEYDPVTHQYRMAAASHGVGTVATSGSWANQAPYGAVWSTLPVNASLANAVIGTVSSGPTVAFDYVIRVTSKNLVFSTLWSGASAGWGRWVGLFDSLIENAATDDPVPIFTGDVWSSQGLTSSNNYSGAATTRTPLPATHSVWRAANQVSGLLSSWGNGSGLAASGHGALGASADAWNPPTQIGPRFVVMDVVHTTDGRRLQVRGSLPGTVSTGGGTGLSVRDEFVFDGKTWVVIGFTASFALAIDKALT